MPVGQGLSKSTNNHQVEETFLECLDLLTDRGTPLSETPNSPFYAPKAMKRLEATKKISMRDLARAMERLFAAGKIRNEQVGKPSDQRRVIVRVESE